MWRLINPRPVRADGVSRMIVGHDVDDVRTTRALGLCRHARRLKDDGQEEARGQVFHLRSLRSFFRGHSTGILYISARARAYPAIGGNPTSARRLSTVSSS